MLGERPGNQENSQGPGLVEAPFSELLKKKGGEDLVLPANRTQTTEGGTTGAGSANQGQEKEKAGWVGGETKRGVQGGDGLKTEGVFPPSRAGASSREETREKSKDGCRGAVVTMLTRCGPS